MAIDKSDIESLRDGLSATLSKIETAVQLEIYAERLPIIGAKLQETFGGEQALKQIQTFDIVVTAALNAIIGLNDFSEVTIETQINNAIINAGFVGVVDATFIGDEFITLGFNVDKTTASFETALDSSFGLPGIEFKTSGTAQAQLSYDLEFTVGLDASGFYLDTTNDSLGLELNVTVPGLTAEAATLGFIDFKATDQGSSLEGVFAIDMVGGSGRLRLENINDGLAGEFNASLTGKADIDIHLEANMDVAVLPDISADLSVDWQFNASVVTSGDNNVNFGSTPEVALNNVKYDFDQFVDQFIEPVLEAVTPIFEPINAGIDIFRANLDFLQVIPGFKAKVDVAGKQDGSGNDIGDGHITLIDFLEIARPETDSYSIIQWINLADDIIDWTLFLDDKVFGGAADFELGSFDLLGDIRSLAFNIESATQNISNTVSGLAAFLDTLSGTGYDEKTKSGMTGTDILKEMFLGDDTAFDFPVLNDPREAIRMLLGGSADMFSLDLPSISMPLSPHVPLLSFPIPFFPILTIGLEGQIGFAVDLGFGYDTSGLQDFATSGNYADVLNGFYLSDWDTNGNDVAEFSIEAVLSLILSFTTGVPGTTIGGSGSIAGVVDLNLNDELGSGAIDGKLYWDEIGEALATNPFAVFDASGSIEAFFSVFVRVFGYDVWRYSSPRITLGEFSFDDDPGADAPETGLGTVNGQTLTLNFGSKAGSRLTKDKVDGDEAVQVSQDQFGGIQVKHGGAQYRLTSVEAQSLTKVVLEDGGIGNDQLEVNENFAFDVEASGGAGDDVIYGGKGNDTFYGNDDRDYLFGRDGNDTLDGGAGDDVLEGGAGADTLIGGDGSLDIATYENSKAAVTVDLANVANNKGDAEGDTYSGIEIWEGTRDYDDVLSGSNNGEMLVGLGGNDKLYGGGGDDTLGGGEGNDVLDGGTGNDKLHGGKGDDTYYVDSLNDVVDEDGLNPGDADGNDRVISSISYSIENLEDIEDLDLVGNAISGTGNKFANIINGNDKDNVLDGEGGDDTIHGKDGLDSIAGGDGVDHLFGEAGNDLLDGGAGADQLDGGADDDILSGGADGDTLKGDIGNDVLDGGAGIDTLEGNAGDDTYVVDDAADVIVEGAGEGKDTLRASVDFALAADDDIEVMTTVDAAATTKINLTGNALAQSLTGNKGDNVLEGMGGADDLDGGEGTDVASYVHSSSTVQIDLGAGTFKGGDAEGDTIANIEAIWGSNVTGPGDKLTGSAGDDIALHGKGGDDELSGLGGADKLFGGDGEDTLDGGAGDDVMDGGAGDDIYYVDSLGDTVHEGNGGDGSGGVDRIIANLDYSLSAKPERADIENLDLVGAARKGTGNGQNNTITGTDFDDVLDGATGSDLLIGGKGDDIYYFDSLGDQVTELANEGTEQIYFTTQFLSDKVINTTTLETWGANVENFEVTDSHAILDITGNALDNVIIGNAKTGTIHGLDGNDTLVGGGDIDWLYGGEGDDRGVFDRVGRSDDDRFYGGNGVDILVMDWSTAAHNIESDNSSYFRVFNPTFGINDYITYSDVERFELTGGSGRDNLFGRALEDILTGNNGNDLLSGFAGKGTYDGGADTDFVIATVASTVVDNFVLKLSDTQSGFVTVNGGTAIETHWKGIEFVHLTTGDGNDTLDVRGIVGNGRDWGLVGDTFIAGKGDDTFAIDFGSIGEHVFTAGDGIDTLIIDWSAAVHNIETDSSSYYRVFHTSVGSNDYVTYSSVERFQLTGGSARDNLLGGALDDILTGNDGNDLLRGLTGKGTYDGGGNTDFVVATVASTVTDNFVLNLKDTQSEWVTVNGGTAIETKWKGVEFVNLTTGGGNDTLDVRGIIGNGRDWDLVGNTFKAGEGNDTFAIDFGSIGEHVFTAGDGIDTLIIDWSAALHNIETDSSSYFRVFHTGPGALDYVQYSGVERFQLTGGSARDNLLGGALDDILTGNSGNDLLRGLAGKGTYDGGANTDFVVATVASTVTDSFVLKLNDTQSGWVTVNGGTAIETKWKGVEFVHLTTGDGNDTLDARGIVGNGRDWDLVGNTFIAGKGDDTFAIDFGSIGEHVFTAGDGVDTLTIDWSAAIHNIETDSSSYYRVFHTSVGSNDYVTYSGVERFHLTGGSANDNLLGGAIDDILIGNAGIDLLRGLTGKGTYDGGADTDYVVATVDSTVADSFVLKLSDAQSKFVTVNAGTAIETKWKDVEFVNLTTGDGNDTLDVRGIVGYGRDWGFPGNTFSAGKGDDTFAVDFGSIGDHTFTAGDGIDTLIIDWSAAVNHIETDSSSYFRVFRPSVGTNDYVYYSGVERFQLTGGSGNDNLAGGALDDILTGGGGIDLLRGLAGKGTYDGGAGTDYVVATIASTVADSFVLKLSDTQSKFVTVNAGTAIETKWKDVEFVDLTTGDGNDTLDARGIVGFGRDWGFPGNTFNAGKGDDTFAVDFGSIGDHTFTAGDGVDTLIIDWSAATNNIEGVDGSYLRVFRSSVGTNDYVYYSGVERFELTGGSGHDNLAGSALNDILTGNDGNDTLRAGDGNDKLDGGSGNDRLEGGAGADTLTGGLGDDTYVVDSTDDKVVEKTTVNEGTDTVESSVTFTLGTFVENLTLFGTAKIDGTGNNVANIIVGNDGSNTLKGMDGADTLSGGQGDDILDGGAGSDALNGGGGTDTATFASLNAAVTASLAGGSATTLNGKVTDTDTLTSIENLIGTKFNDNLIGNGGDNIIEGGLGDDVMVGDGGTDTVVYASATKGVVVSLLNTSKQSTGGAGNDTISGFENIVGSAFGDTLTGTAGDNALTGGAGDDLLIGGAGADKLFGGDGVDTVSFAAASGGVYALLISGGAGGDALGDAYDSIENLIGSSHNDTLYGNSGANKIEGGAGNDIIHGWGGKDVLDGGAGVDHIDFETAASGVTATFGAFTAATGAVAASKATVDGEQVTFSNFENAAGSAHNDTFIGNAGANSLIGRDGDDILIGGLGNDELAGGTGNDTASFADIKTSVVASLITGTASYKNGTANDLDQLYSIENLIGGSANDTLTGDAGDNVIEGGLGDDILEGGEGAETDGDTLSYVNAAAGVTVNLSIITKQDTKGAGKDTITNFENVIGSSKGDTITGDNENNILRGGLGDDILAGGLGNDVLDGGGGVDTASYAGATDGVSVDLSITGQQDTIFAGLDTLIGIENLTGSNSGDILIGNDLANTLSGADGTDVLRGGKGNDTLIGGNGDDTLEGGEGDDTINGDGGIVASNSLFDTVTYASAGAGVIVSLAITAQQNTVGAGKDKISGVENITGSGFDDVLTGDAKNNQLVGGTGSDVLSGGAGNDTLYGGFDNDILEGGLGSDHLEGGNGNDTASFKGVTAALSIDLSNGDQPVTIGTGKTAEIDTLVSIENLIGGSGADKLTGSADDNIIEGGLGDDILEGGGQGANGDTVSFANSATNITFDLSNTSVQTTGAGKDKISGFENVLGSAKDDRITGDGGNNVIDGGAGNDTLLGSGGQDTFIGGLGTDTLSYAAFSAAVTVHLENKFGLSTFDSKAILFESIENLVGSKGDDWLYGDAAANKIEGGEGNDYIEGGLGDDTLIGGTNTAAGDSVSFQSAGNAITVDLAKTTAQVTGAGKDTISGFENVAGGDYADTLFGDKFANTLSGGNGDDLMRGGLGSDSLIGGDGSDTASFTDITTGVTVTLVNGDGDATYLNGKTVETDKLSGIENLIGGTGKDVLTGDSADNVIEGGAGDDTLVGGNHGVNGDTVSYASATAGVTVDLNIAGQQDTKGAGKDTITGFENIIGSSKNDVLKGVNGQSNIIEGGAGDDIIKFNPSGNDLLNGGSGIDTLDCSEAISVSIQLGSLVADLTGGGEAALFGFENAIGSVGNDVIRAASLGAVANKLDGGAGNDLIEGGNGDDTLIGGAGIDKVSFANSTAAITFDLSKTASQVTGAGKDTVSGFESVEGGALNDVLFGDKTNNELDGLAGDDYLQGGLGNDVIVGGFGIDTVSFADISTGVTLVINDGPNDSFATYKNGTKDETDTIREVENIVGGSGNDTFTGNSSDNVIEGGLGNDVLNGGDNAVLGDTVSYASATAGVTVNLTIAGVQDTKGAGKDTISNFENITGGKGNDFLVGDSGSNTISGGTGNDVIVGDGNADTLIGGLGNDTFVYSVAGHGGDTIMDFALGDKIQIIKTGFGIAATVTLTGAGINNFGNEYFTANANGEATKAHGQFVYDTTNNALLWDGDGTGVNAGVTIATFDNAYVLKATDFTLA